MICQLTNGNNDPIWINPAYIIRMESYLSGTVLGTMLFLDEIQGDGQRRIFVREPVEQVVAKIDPDRRSMSRSRSF